MGNDGVQYPDTSIARLCHEAGTGLLLGCPPLLMPRQSPYADSCLLLDILFDVVVTAVHCCATNTNSTCWTWGWEQG
jgi:hypothetical protein